MDGMREAEWEWEARDGESEREAGDGEYEGEEFLGGLIQGIGSALGLGEGEGEADGEYEWEAGDGEYEWESGDGEYEWESGDGEYEWESGDGEYEGEEFLPALLPLAKMALPLLGGLFRKKKRRRPAREFEDEFEYEGEFEDEFEYEGEGEDEQFLGGLIQGIGSALGLGEGEQPAQGVPATAEVMAAMAADTPSAAEADALVGAATVMVLTPRERRVLEQLIPQLVQATTVLSRLMRRRRVTRPAIRVIPTVVKATARPLVAAAVRGHPPTTSVAGRVLTQQTRTVLTRPAVTRAVMKRNAAAVRKVAGRRTPPGIVRPRRPQPVR
ncbi:hypothetical protein [Blastococcus xanthinilyticus]|uniref:hypothetical protein n=1 Tax=Blastococcus xanthinilyticus TaxID=1564164 RepID=UPI0014134F3E|nr:hypothetical protein [Blastococcus xanthinilyticus]